MTIKDVCGRFQEKMSTCYIQINRINTTTFNQFINITHVGTSDSPRGIEHKDERLRKDLQEDLVTFYEDEYKAIPVSPLVPGHDANILDFYVKPNMQIAQWNIAGRFTRGSPKSQVISYKDVFMNGSSKCHDIYVTAKAGNGKTTFAKRLCMIWCCTKGGSKISYSRYIIIEENDLAMLQTFSFLFFIPLREVRGNECDLDDIIYSQVIDRLSRSQLYDRSFLKTILHEETSLVILEGLDEWFHPERSVCTNVSSIPHRKPREKCTFLSTTRVSKMYQAGIKNSRVDKYIKMTELGEESVKQLIHNVVLSMTGTDKEVESAEKFIQQLRHILSELAATPIILIQLLCLWRDGRTTGKTICDIYLNIIELMLQLREERHGKMCFSTARNQTEQSKPPPSSLKKYEYCRKYYQLLVSIGCISFKGTFSGVHSPSLVYESSIVQSILSEKEIRCCLQMGILTEKTAKGFSKKVSNYSFNHKTYQEFFTALYVQAYSSTECVLAFCQNLETILSMKSVLVFLSGLNSELFSLLSHQLSNAMSDFCFLRSFRRIDALMNSDLSENHHLLKLYQDMNISCVRECELEGKTVYLDDFFLDEHIKNKEYCCTLRTLIKMNRQRIKSLTITDLSANMLRESVDMFQLNRMDTLVKIFIRCEIDEKDLDILLKSSVKTLKCIRIVSSIWKGSCSTRRHIPLSEIACNAIENMPELVSLVMEYLILTHSQLENLVTWVERKITLEQFGLSGIKCKDHGETCPGAALDMSGHSHIESLVLDLSPVSNIKVNLAALQECSVGECYAECVLFDMLKNLEKANKLRAVQYFHLTPPKVIEQALNTLQKLTGLVSLELHEIDLGQTDLKLPESMKNIRCIRLDDMKLSETVLQNLLTRIKMFQQPVRIDMWNCQITPEDSFLMLKDSIHSSDEFRE
ncbi:uncharacterized protein LOC123549603 [Mercenaria mercenaria]|uniref:uncharacterized protein LOC123549603 n=1 Tax=Mercenaria mercenaria TaxID=6596 RepID=UPI00234EBA63|nr:uncharacterized protein LOC123549603 [Mercenaria mercenaria]